ncbi:MAG: hypothetical protein ACRC67_09580 [Inquilinus sp.]|uniref:hypothetical protein n=1 Tax=Inquilinus sp. TaxID=1932117 RepID=UPI003F2E867C
MLLFFDDQERGVTTDFWWWWETLNYIDRFQTLLAEIFSVAAARIAKNAIQWQTNKQIDQQNHQTLIEQAQSDLRLIKATLVEMQINRSNLVDLPANYKIVAEKSAEFRRAAANPTLKDLPPPPDARDLIRLVEIPIATSVYDAHVVELTAMDGDFSTAIGPFYDLLKFVDARRLIDQHPLLLAESIDPLIRMINECIVVADRTIPKLKAAVDSRTAEIARLQS